MRIEITQEQLKSIALLDSENGVLIRTVRTSRHVMIGSKMGKLDGDGYLSVSIYKVRYKVHRLIHLYIYGSMPSGEIDHINGDKLDNRPSNLRDVSRVENQQNIRKPYATNTSGYMGVSWIKRDRKWEARIGVSKKRIRLGYFDDPAIAYETYLVAKRNLHSTCTI